MSELSPAIFPRNEPPEEEMLTLDKEFDALFVLQGCKAYLERFAGLPASHPPFRMPNDISGIESLPAAPPEDIIQTVNYTERADMLLRGLDASMQTFINSKEEIIFGEQPADITDAERLLRKRGAITGRLIDVLARASSRPKTTETPQSEDEKPRN